MTWWWTITRQSGSDSLLNNHQQREPSLEPHANGVQVARELLGEIGGAMVCKIHASCICGEMAAVLSLADYKDAFVNTHTGSTLGDKCDSCGAYNFQEERTGTTEHFNICCQNGKVCCQQHNPKAMIKHCAPPPPELLDILTGRSAQKRQARGMLKKYNNAFAFVSYGENASTKLTVLEDRR